MGADWHGWNVFQVNTKDKKAASRLEFYHGPLRPLIEAYTVTAMCLKRLIGEELAESDLTHHVLDEMHAHYKKGFVAYRKYCQYSIKNKKIT